MRTTLIILEQAFLNFPLVMGAYIAISLMKVPDLSLESAYVFGAICAARTLMATEDLPAVVACTLVVLAATIGGSLVGLTSSLLTRKAKLPHLLSAILTTGLFHGINQFTLGTSNESISRYANYLAVFSFMSTFKRYPELPSLMIAFVLLVALGWWFFTTQLGYSLATLGNNQMFFSHYGISTDYIFISGILLSNSLAGLAGYFDATSGGFVDISMGSLKALFCVTTLILGKTLVRPSKPFSVFVPVVGILSYFTLQQCLLKVGFNLKYFTMIQSLIVLVFLVVTYRNKRIRINHLGV